MKQPEDCLNIENIRTEIYKGAIELNPNYGEVWYDKSVALLKLRKISRSNRDRFRLRISLLLH